MIFDLEKINSLEDLKKIKNLFYSLDGELEKLKREIKKTEDIKRKKDIGLKIKELKERADLFFLEAKKKIEKLEIDSKITKEIVDINLPLPQTVGLHPITLIIERIRSWLINNGYFEMKGSEITDVTYNFERLNIPSDHPAREEGDSLFFDSKMMLRTHNTGFSALILEKLPDKDFAQFSIGKVYRNDTEDQTHSHQFHQVDILAVGRNINLSNLVWTLKKLLDYVLERDVQIRLRPSFFPFTSPSLEVDIFLDNKWVEVLGSGMIHPRVFEMAGCKDKNLKALAAGIGVERLAMIKYRIKDVREFTINDIRFLKQFK